MRTVSFVENLEFDYQGNIFSKAMTVGDVDNDTVSYTHIEFIVLWILNGKVKFVAENWFSLN